MFVYNVHCTSIQRQQHPFNAISIEIFDGRNLKLQKVRTSECRMNFIAVRVCTLTQRQQHLFNAIPIDILNQ